MKENFLHYVWKTKSFRYQQLEITSGEKIEIRNGGMFHHDSGPDFQNAKIKIGNTIWAGHIEIHVKSSDWNQHKHSFDEAYDNVILHVVYENDFPVKRKTGEEIFCLELKDRIDLSLIEKYEALMQNSNEIPCENQIRFVDSFTITSWKERLLIERLEQKTKSLLELLNQNTNNWEETFYQSLAQSFGSRVNANAFLLTANSLPMKILAKHKNNLQQLESLLFGVAGLLDRKFYDDYPNELKKEFRFLSKKYQLKPIEKGQWKLLRLRPANFPYLRIAQFASLIEKSSHLFSRILDCNKIQDVIRLFHASVSDYWLTHYVFDKESMRKEKQLAESFVDLLLINTVIPFMFLYGKLRSEENFCDKALAWMQSLPAERNFITKHWISLGIPNKHASDSQALIQLQKNYCNEKRCLDCAIGNKILRRSV
jgi:hypothetical protein